MPCFPPCQSDRRRWWARKAPARAPLGRSSEGGTRCQSAARLRGGVPGAGGRRMSSAARRPGGRAATPPAPPRGLRPPPPVQASFETALGARGRLPDAGLSLPAGRRGAHGPRAFTRPLRALRARGSPRAQTIFEPSFSVAPPRCRGGPGHSGADLHSVRVTLRAKRGGRGLRAADKKVPAKSKRVRSKSPGRARLRQSSISSHSADPKGFNGCAAAAPRSGWRSSAAARVAGWARRTARARTRARCSRRTSPARSAANPAAAASPRRSPCGNSTYSGKRSPNTRGSLRSRRVECARGTARPTFSPQGFCRSPAIRGSASRRGRSAPRRIDSARQRPLEPNLLRLSFAPSQRLRRLGAAKPTPGILTGWRVALSSVRAALGGRPMPLRNGVASSSVTALPFASN